MQMFLKILSGIANSVDPDANLSDTLVYEILGHLLFFERCCVQLQKKFAE